MMYSREELRRLAEVCFSIDRERSPFSSETMSEVGRIVHSQSFRRLQGKTQLFPAGESSLLRNRLTHSLEVSEIAARIASKINTSTGSKLKRIDISIVTAAGLAHDLGHPPFGHTGELALNQRMAGFGGFEGNAQTLRILTKLENRLPRVVPKEYTPDKVKQKPFGLNLMLRTIASIIKYDKIIPFSLNTSDILPVSAKKSLMRGYYESEAEVVFEVKKAILRGGDDTEFRTIECDIMDIADDIAYSAYDFEDCMISRVASPNDILALRGEEIEEIANLVSRQMEKYGYAEQSVLPHDVHTVFNSIFLQLLKYDSPDEYNVTSPYHMAAYVNGTYYEGKNLARNLVYRRWWIELLIDARIEAISVKWNEANLALSRISISTEHRLKIECLKAFNYIKVINSQMLRVNAHKGSVVVWALFDALMEDDSDSLIFNDFKYQYPENDFIFVQGDDVLFAESGLTLPFKVNRDVTVGNLRRRMRFVCDYIASLTDDEALEMCGRLKSVEWKTVFGLQF